MIPLIRRGRRSDRPRLGSLAMEGQLSGFCFLEPVFIRIALVCLAVVGFSPSFATADFVLSDFNHTGFNYTFDNFVETIGPQSVRVTDSSDGWGGGGISFGSEFDLSSYESNRLVVNFTPEFGNQVERFDLELIDANNTTGKWTFEIGSLPTSTPAQLTATTVLGEPTSGIGNFQNLDLSRITTWQVLGDYGSPLPFDISFDRVAITGTPTAYPGAESDAAWRQVAANRIEANRKANLSISVVDAAGTPVPNANVSVAMQRHEFGFGSAVQAFRLSDNDSRHAAYKQKVQELFNVATLENNLKWPPWEGEWGSLWTQSGASAALDWISQQNIEGRGHVMVWPGENNLPQDIQNIIDGDPLTPSEQQYIRNRISAHINTISAATNGRVTAWDVINETRTNNDLMNLLSEGDDAMIDWFAQAAAATASSSPDLYINDFGILSSSGNTNSSNQNHYFNTIQQLINDGASIDGVGFQGHFRENEITGPEQLWTIFDRFAQLGLSMQVTEFDFETTDEQLQADYTRDFLIAAFAHEGISDVIQWGFWEDAHWRPDAAMYRSDWSIKPNGQAYLDLVFGEWWTDEQLLADSGGLADLRGFKGDYLVAASAGASSSQQQVALAGNGSAVVLVLPMLVGDYNQDGTVDSADYAVWRDELGMTGPSPADGDRNGVVDLVDLELWLNNFGNTLPAGFVSSIPEPSALLTVLNVVVLTAVRRHRTATVLFN